MKKFYHTWIYPIINVSKLIKALPKYLEYFRDLKKYAKMKGAELINLKNAFPVLYDKSKITNVDYHYFHQDIWAYKKIYNSQFNYHVDVGSSVDFVAFLSVIKRVTFIDIRPLLAKLENLESKKGNILSMPYDDNSVSSLSCLHVAEHIGLGRYGDDLDPLGTKKAADELSRILALNGNLYFSVPIGKPRLCFNGHRIHSTKQILNYFSDLKLIELSGVDDNGNFIVNIEENLLDSCNYGCGFFWFTKS